MISFSVSPTNLWPMLGNLLTILCVRELAGLGGRGFDDVREVLSNDVNNEFVELDIDGNVDDAIGMNADNFVRFKSSESLWRIDGIDNGNVYVLLRERSKSMSPDFEPCGRPSVSLRTLRVGTESLLDCDDSLMSCFRFRCSSFILRNFALFSL